MGTRWPNERDVLLPAAHRALPLPRGGPIRLRPTHDHPARRRWAEPVRLSPAHGPLALAGDDAARLPPEHVHVCAVRPAPHGAADPSGLGHARESKDPRPRSTTTGQ